MAEEENKITEVLLKALKLVSCDENKEAKSLVDFILNKNKNNLNEIKTNDWQYIANISLATGNLALAQIADKNIDNKIQEAFILIIQYRLNEAGDLLSISNPSSAKDWCTFLINLFSYKNTGEIKKWPTFLQIRHFLEFTVYYLILNNKNDYVEKIFKALDKLMEINFDSEKFIGYAYIHSGKTDEGIEILNDCIRKNQYDGEIYFILGQTYFTKKTYHEALSMLENARLFLPGHYPTKELLEKVKSLL